MRRPGRRQPAPSSRATRGRGETRQRFMDLLRVSAAGQGLRRPEPAEFPRKPRDVPDAALRAPRGRRTARRGLLAGEATRLAPAADPTSAPEQGHGPGSCRCRTRRRGPAIAPARRKHPRRAPPRGGRASPRERGPGAASASLISLRRGSRLSRSTPRSACRSPAPRSLSLSFGPKYSKAISARVGTASSVSSVRSSTSSRTVRYTSMIASRCESSGLVPRRLSKGSKSRRAASAEARPRAGVPGPECVAGRDQGPGVALDEAPVLLVVDVEVDVVRANRHPSPTEVEDAAAEEEVGVEAQQTVEPGRRTFDDRQRPEGREAVDAPGSRFSVGRQTCEPTRRDPIGERASRLGHAWQPDPRHLSARPPGEPATEAFGSRPRHSHGRAEEVLDRPLAVAHRCARLFEEVRELDLDSRTPRRLPPLCGVASSQPRRRLRSASATGRRASASERPAKRPSSYSSCERDSSKRGLSIICSPGADPNRTPWEPGQPFARTVRPDATWSAAGRSSHAWSAKSMSWFVLPNVAQRPVQICVGCGHQWPAPTAR